MKKLLSALCALVLSGTALCMPVSAEDDGDFYKGPFAYQRLNTASWQDTFRYLAELNFGDSVEDCIIKETEYVGYPAAYVYTPHMWYFVYQLPKNPFRITVKDGTEPTAEILDQIRDYHTTTAGITYGYQLTPSDTPDTYEISVTSSAGGTDPDLQEKAFEILRSDPNIVQIEKSCGYIVIDDSWGYQFTASGDPGLTAEQLVPVLGAEVQVTPTGTTDENGRDEYRISAGASYFTYFNSYKDVQALDCLDADSLVIEGIHDMTAPSETLPTSDQFDTLFYRGDLSGDNTVDIKDAVLLARLTAEDDTLTCAVQNADYNADGLVDLRDIRDMTRALTFTESE